MSNVPTLDLVKKARTRLRKAVEESNWDIVLRTLGALNSFTMDPGLLQNSGVGKTVKKLQSAENTSIANRAKMLIIRWTKVIKAENDKKKNLKRLQQSSHDEDTNRKRSKNKSHKNSKRRKHEDEEEVDDDSSDGCDQAEDDPNEKIPKLSKLSLACVLEHEDEVGKLSRVPFSQLKPLFKKCKLKNLERLENLNPSIRNKTDRYWKEFCKPPFPDSKPDNGWRGFYRRQQEEKERKLERLEAKLQNRYHNIESDKNSTKLVRVAKLQEANVARSKGGWYTGVKKGHVKVNAMGKTNALKGGKKKSVSNLRKRHMNGRR